MPVYRFQLVIDGRTYYSLSFGSDDDPSVIVSDAVAYRDTDRFLRALERLRGVDIQGSITWEVV